MNLQTWDILRSAVTDVGYWSWWASDFPRVFQVEFGGVQLRPHSPQQGQRPPGQVAFTFVQPKSVSFLTRRIPSPAVDPVPDDWATLLHRDRLKPPPPLSSEDLFALDASAFEPAMNDAQRVETVFGRPPLDMLRETVPPVSFVFWARRVGAAVIAEDVKLLTHGGELPLAEVPAAHQRWWEYWR
jgi:hypothetical protein